MKYYIELTWKFKSFLENIIICRKILIVRKVIYLELFYILICIEKDLDQKGVELLFIKGEKKGKNINLDNILLVINEVDIFVYKNEI